MMEKTAHAGKFPLTFDDHPALLGIELRPRDIERDIDQLGKALQLGEERAIFGLGPGLDGALVQRFRFIRNDEIKIEVDGVAKTLAARTRAVRIVERKQARLRFFVAQVALFALEALGKSKLLR